MKIARPVAVIALCAIALVSIACTPPTLATSANNPPLAGSVSVSVPLNSCAGVEAPSLNFNVCSDTGSGQLTIEVVRIASTSKPVCHSGFPLEQFVSGSINAVAGTNTWQLNETNLTSNTGGYDPKWARSIPAATDALQVQLTYTNLVFNQAYTCVD